MGSFSLVIFAAFLSLMVSSSSAELDERNLEQREVTFDLGPIKQERSFGESIEMQQEADLSDLIDIVKEISMSEKMDTSRGKGFRPRHFAPRGFHPDVEFHSEIPMLNYPVQFPLGRPTADNLQAICMNGDLRPRYPDSYFPRSGFGQLRRRASAINIGESWLSTCCMGNQTWGTNVTLCCVTQAWELSLENFCTEDSSVKDRLHHCCREKGSQRLDCFQKDSPNPSYDPTEALPVVPLHDAVEFNFDQNNCSSSPVTQPSFSEQSSSKKSELIFPPARPRLDNLDSLCRNQKLRPMYTLKCLPKNGYELLARQAKLINRVEKGYKQCCKKNHSLLECAEQKWRDAIGRFCSSKKGGKTDYECCVGSPDNQVQCFQSASPDPNYNVTSQEVLSPQICQSRKIIKKVLPDGFHAKNILNECCTLPAENQAACFVQKIEGTSTRMCPAKKTAPPLTRRCCRMAPQGQPKCFINFVMDAITKATKVSNRKKKRCPL
ncbi:extracellular matrix protein 1 isoform X2 [Stigmatopora nigra]